MQVIIPLAGWRPGARRRLQRRWLGFWRQVGAQGDPLAVFAALDRRYREPHRHYHTWEHIGECLDVLGWARPLAQDLAAVEMALWFHLSLIHI